MTHPRMRDACWKLVGPVLMTHSHDVILLGHPSVLLSFDWGSDTASSSAVTNDLSS